MKRILLAPRHNWQEKVQALGLVYHTPNGERYWDESVCYRFTSREVDELEAASAELQRICLFAAQFILDNHRFSQLQIPESACNVIRKAWESEPPSIYGRFDLAYDGVSPPKLLEYNANTPTALLEASVVQWHWRQEVFPATDQFNSIHEKLIIKWSDLKHYLRSDTLYFTCMHDDEDFITVSYLRDTAQQAGIHTEHLYVSDVGWNANDNAFRNLHDQPITSLFALYPWEWLLKDFPGPILSTYSSMDWIEPIWKMLWSNKALLAILWELFPDHPNLLPAYLNSPRHLREFVRKPLLSREGANITIHRNGGDVTTPGPYGAEGFVYQALAPQSNFDGYTPVIGSWYITDEGPAGIGIRESEGITTNLSRFVPHYLD
jgi:glutathionylspermidine synthase